MKIHLKTVGVTRTAFFRLYLINLYHPLLKSFHAKIFPETENLVNDLLHYFTFNLKYSATHQKAKTFHPHCRKKYFEIQSTQNCRTVIRCSENSFIIEPPDSHPGWPQWLNVNGTSWKSSHSAGFLPTAAPAVTIWPQRIKTFPMERQEGHTGGNLLWKMAEDVIYVLSLVKCHQNGHLRCNYLHSNCSQLATTFQLSYFL